MGAMSGTAEVAEILRRRGETVAVAESAAGGFLSAALLAVPGASAYFLGGAVIYTRRAGQVLLDIGPEAMGEIRPATEPYALLLARTVRERHGATWGVAETGAAGPTGNRYGDAAGHAALAVRGPIEASTSIETGSADREANMRAFVSAAIALLGRALNG